MLLDYQSRPTPRLANQQHVHYNVCEDVDHIQGDDKDVKIEEDPY